MRLLLDTDVVLDVLLEREGFVEPTNRLFALAEAHLLEGVPCAATMTTVDDLVAKTRGRRAAHAALRDLLDLFDAAPVEHETLRRALDAPLADFEDAVLHEAARAQGADAIVTRDAKDDRKGDLPAWLPAEAVARLAGARPNPSFLAR